MHAWHTWGSVACTTASQRDLPLAVFVGDALDSYTATWWRDLSLDHDLQTLLAERFVAVRAERSQHPGLAALTQQVLALSADASGVPALLVLLPGDPAPIPCGAMPYGPLRDAGGRKGLARVLLEVAQAWTHDRDGLLGQALDLRQQLAGLPFLLGGQPPRSDPGDLAEAQAMAEAHTLHGGFGTTPDGACALPRWPRAGLLQFLAGRRDPAPALQAHVERTASALIAGAIHDQFGGGFFRAAGTADWGEPLTDKHLGDQALLALALRATGTAWHAEVAERALDWCEATLALGDGVYAAGIHAGDGSCYRWTRAEVAAVVGEDGAQLIATRYGIDDTPRIPAVRDTGGDPARLATLVRRLAAARCERPQPQRDERPDLAALGWFLAARPGNAALCQHLAGTTPDARRPVAAAAIAYGLAVAGDAAAHAWLDTALERRSDGLFPVDDDALVSPMPCDAEDTVDGPGAASAVALAAHALGRHDVVAQVRAAHAGLLRRAPVLAPALLIS